MKSKSRDRLFLEWLVVYEGSVSQRTPSLQIPHKSVQAANARGTDEKYRGSYDTSIMKRFQQFANSPHVHEDSVKPFTPIALNCALHNGDAHLKNFSVLYENVLGEARLAPVYDLVTTTAYLPQDRMALTMNGSTGWPDAQRLFEFGAARMTGSPAQIRAIVERIADALSETAKDVRRHAKKHPAFAEVGARMIEEWKWGRRESLGL
jgi:serine/threonine-protein kinase HipA